MKKVFLVLLSCVTLFFIGSRSINAAQHYIDNDTIDSAYNTGQHGIWSYVWNANGSLYGDHRWVSTLDADPQRYSWACNYRGYGEWLHVVSIYVNSNSATGMGEYYWNSMKTQVRLNQMKAAPGWNQVWYHHQGVYNPSKGVLLIAKSPYVVADGMYIGDNK